jgi:glycosyltransferase involved in cell wall biosynthesis
LLLDPRDVDAWAEALTRLEQDREYADALADAGRRHAQRFTWERAAMETAAVHDSLLSNQRSDGSDE